MYSNDDMLELMRKRKDHCKISHYQFIHMWLNADVFNFKFHFDPKMSEEDKLKHNVSHLGMTITQRKKKGFAPYNTVLKKLSSKDIRPLLIGIQKYPTMKELKMHRTKPELFFQNQNWRSEILNVLEAIILRDIVQHEWFFDGVKIEVKDGFEQFQQVKKIIDKALEPYDIELTNLTLYAKPKDGSPNMLVNYPKLFNALKWHGMRELLFANTYFTL